MELETTEEELVEHFKNYVGVCGAKIIVDPFTHVSKGYGFVDFSDEGEASK